MSAITITSLTKKYGDVTAVDNLNAFVSHPTDWWRCSVAR